MRVPQKLLAAAALSAALAAGCPSRVLEAGVLAAFATGGDVPHAGAAEGAHLLGALVLGGPLCFCTVPSVCDLWHAQLGRVQALLLARGPPTTSPL